MSDAQLNELGITTIGDRFRLKNFCDRQSSNRQEKIEKMKEMMNIHRGNKKRTATTTSNVDDPLLKRERTHPAKETVKMEIGWMHYNEAEKRYKQKRKVNGGGTRTTEVPKDATLGDCIDLAKQFFFPNGRSPCGIVDDFDYFLGNYNADIITEIEENGVLEPFSPTRYSRTTGFPKPRVYLLSRRHGSEVHSDSEEALLPPVSHTLTNEEELADNISDDSYLMYSVFEERTPAHIGTVSEWREITELQDREYEDSLSKDKEKETKKKEEEELEKLRLTRKERVPPEPTDDNSIRVNVRHTHLGVVSRRFHQDDRMMAVYDWVGSLSKTPHYFVLAKYPKETLYPEVSIRETSSYILTMIAQHESTPLSADENEVSFDTSLKFDDLDDTLQFLEEVIPTFIPVDDDPGPFSEERLKEDFYPLEVRRNVLKDQLEGECHVIISRHDVLQELLKLYGSDENIVKKNVVVSLIEDNAAGDGVLRELFSLFWDSFFNENCDGNRRFVLCVSPLLTQDDLIAVGRIITHMFILCGTFPVRLCKAFVQQLLFGTVDESCLIDSFLDVLPEKERETVLLAVNGDGAFQFDELIDIMDEYHEKTRPTPSNIKSLITKIARSEFTMKPFFALTKIRQGMGSFWDTSNKSEVDALYEISTPTPHRVLTLLDNRSSNAQESKICRWLERYLKDSNAKTLSRFLRFCTASDIITQGMKIKVKLENMPLLAMRPKSQTCFGNLVIPKNYLSYNQLRENLDVYLAMPSQWDLED